MENFRGYITKVVKNIAQDVMKSSIKNSKEIAFVIKFRSQFRKSNKIRGYFEVKGKHIPPFIIGSVGQNSLYGIKSFSKGVISNELRVEDWKRVFNEAKNLGVCSMLLSIGDTKKYDEVINEASKVKSIIFPILMNEHLIKNDIIDTFNDNRNLVPVLNIDSTNYNKTLNLMDELNNKRMVYLAAININKDNLQYENINKILNSIYIRNCRAALIFEHTLNATERKVLDSKKAALRERFKNMIVLSFPTDEKYLGCLSAGRGFIHINSEGWVEPCPFSPCSDRNLKEVTLLDAIESPLFKKIKEGSNSCKIKEI